MKLLSILFFITINCSLLLAQPLDGTALFNYAKENSPSLKNSSLNVQLAEQQIKQAVASGMPKLNGDLGFQNFINIPTTVVPAAAFVPGAPDDELLGLEFGTDFNANYALKLDQLLFSFTYIYGVKAAKSYSELSRLLQLKQMEDLREKILLELGGYILVKKSRLLANRNKKEIETLIKNTQKLINEGFLEKTAITDLLLIDLEMTVLENDLLANEKVALINLKSTIGYPLDSSINLIDSFNLSFNSLSSESLNAQNTNVVKISQQNLLLNEIRLKVAKSEGYPSVYGFFSHQQMAMRNSFDFFDSQKKWYPATLWGFNISIPIFNSGEGQAKTQQKEIAVLMANNELKEIENKIIALQMVIQNNYNSSLMRYENLKQKHIYSEIIYQNEMIKYKNGVSNTMLLTQKKSLLIQAEQELLQKEFDLFRAKVRLEKYTKPIQL